jgi:hypothetical protein
MTIGGSIGLIVVGAILAFAVTFDIAGIRLDMVGLIMMLGGVVGLLFGLLVARRNRVARTTVIDDPEVY